MPTLISDSHKLQQFILGEAKSQGFDLVGITLPDSVEQAAVRLEAAIARKYHGTMDWMEQTLERRKNPRTLWPQVRSIIMLALNYGPDEDPLLERFPKSVKRFSDKKRGETQELESFVAAEAKTKTALAHHYKNCGAISVYARHRDYHDIIKGRLKQIASRLVARGRQMGIHDMEVKVFVDTAPLMEKPLAAAAGLGWQGKHTNLVSHQLGSWFFLGSIFTNIPLESNVPARPSCGSCSRCLQACPTQAFPAPYQLDAKRCISYLTIELKTHIPLEFRTAIGNRIYGCDDCLAVCPWNKFARTTNEIKLQARGDLKAPPLRDLLHLDEERFRSLFSGSPIKRIGWQRFMRNVLIACGNSTDRSLIGDIRPFLEAPEPLPRAMAIWALKQLMTEEEFTLLRQHYEAREGDGEVRCEWQARPHS